MSNGHYIMVRPGYIIALKTRVKGGVTNMREVLEHKKEGETDTTVSRSVRTIENLAEHEAACAARDKARGLIKSATYWTPFGEICPADMVADYYELTILDAEGPWVKRKAHLKRFGEGAAAGWMVESTHGNLVVTPGVLDGDGEYQPFPEQSVLVDGATVTFEVAGDLPGFTAVLSDVSLNAKIRVAQAVVEAHNATAVFTDVRVSTLRGELAKDEDEAIQAVTAEIKDLLGDMDAAIAIGNVKSIRDLASRAGTMAKLLDQQEAAEGHLGRAIEAARKIASAVAKKVDAGGEALADVLKNANTNPINLARFAFGDGDVERPEEAEAGESLPAIATHRFDDLEVDAGAEPIDHVCLGVGGMPTREEWIVDWMRRKGVDRETAISDLRELGATGDSTSDRFGGLEPDDDETVAIDV